MIIGTATVQKPIGIGGQRFVDEMSAYGIFRNAMLARAIGKPQADEREWGGVRLRGYANARSWTCEVWVSMKDWKN